MRLDRNPSGKFIDCGSALYWWLPKMLDWIHGGTDNAVNVCILRIADWLCEKAADQLDMASAELRLGDGYRRDFYIESCLQKADKLKINAKRLCEVAKEFKS